MISTTPQPVRTRGRRGVRICKSRAGIAFACRQLKIHGKVFLPSTTPRQKRSRIRDIGGPWIKQIIGGATFDEASVAAQKFTAIRGHLRASFDDPRTIAGQGTVVKEIFDQASEETTGPSSFLWAAAGCWPAPPSGCRFHPDVHIDGVEPEGAPSMKAH